MSKSRSSDKCKCSFRAAPFCFDLDPVFEQTLWDKKSCGRKRKPKPKKTASDDVQIKPSLNTRVELTTHVYTVPPGTKYVAPKSKKQKRLDRERHKKLEDSLQFCKYSVMRMASPLTSTTLDIDFQSPSAEIAEAKVFPRKASITPSQTYPEPPDAKELTQHEPKSGTIINVKRTKRKKRKRKIVQPPVEPPMGPTIAELIAQELATIHETEEGEGYPPTESYLTKVFRRKVSQLSKTTSYKSRDYKGEEESDAEAEKEDRFISTLVQKFRRESEIQRFHKPKRKIKKGTFENFSFTKLRQPTLKTFYYGVKLGTVHQGNSQFPEASRDKQGICMPIAAYCFSVLKHPDRWTQADIDDVLTAGNDLFMESANTQHLHGDQVGLKTTDLRKYCKIGKMKVRFVVSEPEVTGMIRSDDKKIYNLTKAVNVFFGRYSAGILETDGLCVAIWKDKNFYFFDSGQRTIDLYTHPNGTALMANFYDTTAIVTVLLDRSNLENQAFTIYSIQAYRVLLRDAEEVDSTGVIAETDNFQVLDEEKAVVLGSFDLADKCFGFSRNKQALTIALVALVYSKITPPSSWHKGTADKIIIIGNQLFLECIDDTSDQVKIEDLPAVFTIGPYVVEVYIAPNRFVNFMTKKGRCKLHEDLESFFETNSNAIVQIDDCAIAVWKQRNIYHCVDPYSRNNEGFKCRDGTACVSMHTTLDSLTGTIARNWDQKDMVFHIHALKVCKIHRDPDLNELFPRCLTMQDYPVENFKKHKMKRGKKKAVKQTVTIDHETRAALLEGLPEESVLEVGSTVRSIAPEDISMVCHHAESNPVLQLVTPVEEFVADLDSPSLSDTQIEPEPPEETETAIAFMDLDSFDLTAEEQAMVKRGEGGEGGEGGTTKPPRDLGEGDKGEGEGSDEWYMAASDYTQVGSQSLLSRVSAEAGTEEYSVTIPDEDVPVVARDIQALTRRRRADLEGNVYAADATTEPQVTLSEELAKDSNFVELPDGSEVVLGTANMAAFGGELELMAPFVCVMAGAVARKYAIDSWSKEVVDYVLKCGAELHAGSRSRYDQNYKLEIPRISLGKTDFAVRVDYIFDSYVKPKVLAMAINNMLFKQWRAGILVTPTYSCALFYKNHLYYLYDGFGNSELGLGKGPSNEGVACLARFLDINSLVSRILHNKGKREEKENVEYNRFVLSSCYVKLLPREEEEEEKPKEPIGAGEEEVVDEGEGAEPVEFQTFKKPKEEEPKPPPKMGYRRVDKLHKIQGTKAVGGEKEVSEDLKEDYFVCICACLTLLNTPIKKWDDRKIDEVVDQGIHVHSHVEDLRVCSKKFIKNVLIDDYLFDIAVGRMDFATYESRATLKAAIETMLAKKHQHFIIQFPNRSYALSLEDDVYHLFDPSDSGKASWTRYTNFRKFVRRLKSGLVKNAEGYNFHRFEITAISRAPKHVVVANRARKYTVPKDRKTELICKPFYEEVAWLETDPIPWSWRVNKTGRPFWRSWFVDFADDLFSLFGSISPLDERFPEETRGKQTLGNLVVAIGMTQIYDLADWNVNVMDAVVLNGDAFFGECVKDIADENYEVAFADLKKTCTVFPYRFRVEFAPVVEGTMFLVRLKQFNLYKALRLFFDEYAKRFGVICVNKGWGRRLYAFGKTGESEYFFYDCETLGPPMYVEKDSGVPYIMRMTTMNRLLHVMTLTLRGGDFYIFEVLVSELKPVE